MTSTSDLDIVPIGGHTEHGDAPLGVIPHDTFSNPGFQTSLSGVCNPGFAESAPIGLQCGVYTGGVIGVTGLDRDLDLDPAEGKAEALTVMLDQ
jgi:hypothetical protein